MARDKPTESLTSRVPPVPSSLEPVISQLDALDLQELRVRYRQATRKTAPAHLPRWLLVRMIAYRLQAQVHGDLDAETASLLAGLAKTHEAGLKARAKAETAGEAWVKPAVPKVPAVTMKKQLAVGTEFVREFDGKLHRVKVVEAGFAWNGGTYGSLSQIAKAITGTSWNGPAFFGLRARKPPVNANDANRNARRSGMGAPT